MKSSTWLSVLFLLTVPFTEQALASSAKKCLAVIKPDIEYCKSTNDNMSALSKQECVLSNICNRTFNVTVLNMQPLSDFMPHIMSRLLDECCGMCAKTRKVYLNTSSLNLQVLASSDFVFPVIGDLKISEMYGFHFVPIFEASSAYYVTLKPSSESTLCRLVNSCLNLWPLLVISLLLAVVAGFPIWCLDTYFNKEEFPRSFFIGLFEGN